MNQTKSRWGVSILTLIVFSAFLVSGCGSSQGKIELAGFLDTYENLINEYTSSYDTADNEKKADMVNKIEAMTVDWVEKRNEFAGEVTPQIMNELSAKYDRLTAKFNEFKKTHMG